MEIIRAGSRPSGKGPKDWFAGTVRVDPLFNPFDAERGDDGIARIKDVTQAWARIRCSNASAPWNRWTRRSRCHGPAGTIGYVGVPHGVTFEGQKLFFGQKRMLGGPAPVRRFLPDLMDRVMKGKIQPSKVFDLQLPLAEVAEGYKAMDERRAVKVMLTV